MDVALLTKKFEQIGARVTLDIVVPPARPSPGPRSRFWRQPFVQQQPVRLDVRSDRRGEHFLLGLRPDRIADLRVIDIAPERRHLLIGLRATGSEVKHKFLCGHDERHWFVAAVPPTRAVTTVETAMDALKPEAVRESERVQGLRTRDRHRRRNEAFVRQGEWFFVPAPSFQPDPRVILRGEPLSRNAESKAHVVEECVRLGGRTVYVHRDYPTGLGIEAFEELVRAKPEARRWPWRIMRRNPEVYIRGRVRHADHSTIKLDGWHRVYMNTESQAPASVHVAFLD